MKNKMWKIEAGNSTTREMGLVLHGIPANSKEEALAVALDALPESIEERVWGPDGKHRHLNPSMTLRVYINAGAFTMENVDIVLEED